MSVTSILLMGNLIPKFIPHSNSKHCSFYSLMVLILLILISPSVSVPNITDRTHCMKILVRKHCERRGMETRRSEIFNIKQIQLGKNPSRSIVETRHILEQLRTSILLHKSSRRNMFIHFGIARCHAATNLFRGPKSIVLLNLDHVIVHNKFTTCQSSSISLIDNIRGRDLVLIQPFSETH